MCLHASLDSLPVSGTEGPCRRDDRGVDGGQPTGLWGTRVPGRLVPGGSSQHGQVIGHGRRGKYCAVPTGGKV